VTIYGVEASASLISRITDKIMPQIAEWQARPLESVYPVVFLDGIVFKVRKESKVINRCAYTVLGIRMDGRKEILGLWLSDNESASFWLSVCNELKNRGVKDILIACRDNLTGFSSAIATVFSETEQQLLAFEEKWNKKYPQIAKSWRENWTELSAYFKYPEEIRRIIYTTNAVEGFHRMLRKIIKTKISYPTDESLKKSIYLSVTEISKNGICLYEIGA